MSFNSIFDTMDRRTFMKIMGLTGSGLALNLTGCGNASIEIGAEEVNSYVDPEEFAIPGDEVWYASTCRQCTRDCVKAGCVNWKATHIRRSISVGYA